MFAAILFDLDGTLVNTDPLHYKAWQEILRGYGIEIDQDFYKNRISGRLNSLIIQDILPQLSAREGKELADYKEAKFREGASELKPMAGLLEVLAWTEEIGLKRGLVTNAPRKNVECLLSTLGLTKTFEPVVLGDDLPAGKPDPAPYLIALNQLNLAPEQALAFEDSPSGIRAAVGAGILTIGIASTHPPETLREAGAADAVPDFTAFQQGKVQIKDSP